jgi:hypothetical protein
MSGFYFIVVAAGPNRRKDDRTVLGLRDENEPAGVRSERAQAIPEYGVGHLVGRGRTAEGSGER